MMVMLYVYVKDSEDFVVKKLASKVQSDETIITKEEFEEISGISYYKKHFLHI